MGETKTKKPVRYDDGTSTHGNPSVRDAEGQILFELAAWLFNWQGRYGGDNGITPEHGHAVGKYIVEAVNAYAGDFPTPGNPAKRETVPIQRGENE